jgi:hypothetical protein
MKTWSCWLDDDREPVMHGWFSREALVNDLKETLEWEYPPKRIKIVQDNWSPSE